MTQEFSRSKWGSLKLLRIWCPQDVVGIGAEPIVLSYTVLAHTCAVCVLVLLVLLSSLLYSGYLYLFVMFHNLLFVIGIVKPLLWVLLLLIGKLLLLLVLHRGCTPKLKRWETGDDLMLQETWLLWSGKMVEEAEWMLRQFVLSHKNLWKHITHY